MVEIETSTIVTDHTPLRADPTVYQPDRVPERGEEVDDIKMALKPILQNAPANNLLVTGATGQGKTVSVRAVCRAFEDTVAEMDDVDPMTRVYVDCEGATSSHAVLGHLWMNLRDIQTGEIPDKPTGYTKTDLADMVTRELEAIGGHVIVILDEIEGIGGDDYVLHFLSRRELEDANVGVIAITNDLRFEKQLRKRVESSFGRRSVMFHPYEPDQLGEILKRRAAAALRDTEIVDERPRYPDDPDNDEVILDLESDVLEDDVIPLIAAFSARDHGDARKAIELLEFAADMAERRGRDVVTEDDVRDADDKLTEESVKEGIRSETEIRKLALLAAVEYHLNNGDGEGASTRDLYRIYTDYCDHDEIRPDPVVENTFRTRLNELAGSNYLTKAQYSRGRNTGVVNVYYLQEGADMILDALRDGDEPEMWDRLIDDRGLDELVTGQSDD